MEEAKPPLRVDEVERVIGLLSPLSESAQIVLVGGQALAFWSARFAEASGEIHAVSSKDIDFEGSADSARVAARLLGGEAMIPSPLEPSPMTGTVAFVDGEGIDRTLDFIEAPRGLDADDVRETAIRTEIATPSSAGGAVLWIMHPERCMESRIYNTIDLGRDDALGLAQLEVSVPIARRWSQDLLGDEAIEGRRRQRAVLELNERIFKLCCEDRCFQAVKSRYGIDPFGAVLADPRLPDEFLSKRYPQMQERLKRSRR